MLTSRPGRFCCRLRPYVEPATDGVEQAPFASLKQAGAVRSSSGTTTRGVVGRRGGLAMAAAVEEEPWFDEAKATVLLDHDQLE